MKRLLALVAAGIVLAATAPSAKAVPISYSGQLSNGPTLGTISQPNGNSGNPIGAVYYSFFANAGSLVQIDADRLDGPYDPSFWVFQGTYTDTNDFGVNFPGLQAANFIDFADDEQAPFIAGPFGDPLSSFVAPTTGFYTLAMTNFASNGTPPYDFRINASGIVNAPEPATLAVFGLMAAGAFGVRRRLKATV